MRVRDVGSGREVEVRPKAPFTSERLLIGEFRLADEALNQAISDIGRGASLLRTRRVLMHPMEMIDGGVSEVEERVLLELGGRHAKKTVVWIGRELMDAEVQEKLRS